jgi:hypothetical protein
LVASAAWFIWTTFHAGEFSVEGKIRPKNNS